MSMIETVVVRSTTRGVRATSVTVRARSSVHIIAEREVRHSA
jgi:hypothetical protein